jgi:urease accessory protein
LERTGAALQRLLAWLSPAFPVGGFAWSGGLETAIADGRVTDRTALTGWIADSLEHGTLRNDAIMLALAHRADPASNTLADLCDLLLALSPAAERVEETLAMGAAFRLAVANWPQSAIALPRDCPYPIAVGALARAHGVPCPMTLIAFLTSTVQAQISVAVRLVPLGQTDGLRALAELEPLVAALADEAEGAGLANLGGAAYGADIAQMRHEGLKVRIFRS